LNQKDATLTDLSAQVDKLKEANSKIYVSTEKERVKKDALARTLNESCQKIKAVDNSSLSIAEKKKKNEELKRKLKEIGDRESLY